MDEIRFETKPVQTWYLRLLGYILGRGQSPVHSRLFWQINGDCFMTELTSDPAGPNTEVVGHGDGYMIQISKVLVTSGTVIGGDASQIDKFARLYASTQNGNLNSIVSDRKWYSTPQGYGGPMYDNRNTSNTYISWILSKVCPKLPPMPAGAVGWDSTPLFPGPARHP